MPHLLTPPEQKVYDLIVNEALPYKVIARRIHRSHATVRFHLGNIYAKLGVTGMVELVVKHYRQPEHEREVA